MVDLNQLSTLIDAAIETEIARPRRQAAARVVPIAGAACTWCGRQDLAGLCWPCREAERGER